VNSLFYGICFRSEGVVLLFINLFNFVIKFRCLWCFTKEISQDPSVLHMWEGRRPNDWGVYLWVSMCRVWLTCSSLLSWIHMVDGSFVVHFLIFCGIIIMQSHLATLQRVRKFQWTWVAQGARRTVPRSNQTQRKSLLIRWGDSLHISSRCYDSLLVSIFWFLALGCSLM
jgi:hypothetical protein